MAITVHISDGAALQDRTSRIHAPSSVSWTRNIGNRATATFTIVATDAGYEPSVGHEVAIFDSGNRVWTGSIQEYRKRAAGESGGWFLDVDCVGHEARMDKLFIPPRSYTGQTAGAIVTDLRNSVFPAENIGLGTISAGVTVGRIVFEWTRVTDALDELAALSGFVWWIDADGLLHFGARTLVTSPVTIDGTKVLLDDYNTSLSKTREDLRNRQHLRIATSAFPVTAETFDGDGATAQWDVTRDIREVLGVTITTSTRASDTGTFTAAPANDDTITLDGLVYTWKTTIDNEQPRQLKVQASAVAAAAVFEAAVNDSLVGKGTDYSWPTTEHPTERIKAPGATVTVYAKAPGAAGNAIVNGELGLSFSWAVGGTTGGTDGTNTEQTFGVLEVDTEKDWYYAVGVKTVVQAAGGTPVPPGSFLFVTYRALGCDVLTVEDSVAVAAREAVEGGSGLYQAYSEESSLSEVDTALAKAQKLLDTYGDTGQYLEFRTDTPGLIPGHLISGLSIPKPAVSGDWLIESVSATLPDGTSEHFRYRVTAVDGLRANSWLNFWKALAAGSGTLTSTTAVSGGGGSGGGGGSSNLFLAVDCGASPTNVSSPGSPAAGTILTVVLTNTVANPGAITWDSAYVGGPTQINPGNALKTPCLFAGDGTKWRLIGAQTGQA